jgi:hypothetical protein
VEEKYRGREGGCGDTKYPYHGRMRPFPSYMKGLGKIIRSRRPSLILAPSDSSMMYLLLVSEFKDELSIKSGNQSSIEIRPCTQTNHGQFESAHRDRRILPFRDIEFRPSTAISSLTANLVTLFEYLSEIQATPMPVGDEYIAM